RLIAFFTKKIDKPIAWQNWLHLLLRKKQGEVSEKRATRERSAALWQRPERLDTARRLQQRSTDMDALAGPGSPIPATTIALPCDRGEDEKGAADSAEEQAYNPRPAFSCECGDCSDGNRDLEHGHAAREDFVLMKVCFRCGFFLL